MSDDRQAATGDEPECAVTGADGIPVADDHGEPGQTIRRVVGAKVQLILRVGDGGLELGAGQPDDAGARREPEIPLVVLGDGEHATSGKSICSGDSCKAAVRYAAESVGAAQPHDMIEILVHLVMRSWSDAVLRTVDPELSAARDHTDLRAGEREPQLTRV